MHSMRGKDPLYQTKSWVPAWTAEVFTHRGLAQEYSGVVAAPECGQLLRVSVYLYAWAFRQDAWDGGGAMEQNRRVRWRQGAWL